MKKYFLLYIFVCLTIWSCGDTTIPKNNTSKQTTTTIEKTANPSTTATATDKKKKVVFFGDSLTAAYGLDEDQGFTSLIQKKIDSLDLDYEVVNAGLSGETTAGGNSRIDWILKQPIDIFILELGGNDGLRGIDPDASFKNLQSIINKVKAKYPAAKIVLAGMEAPPNMGDDFTSEFRAMFPKLAKANNTALIPFLLDSVGGIPELNQPDGIHPTAKGHQIVAETIWKVLKEVL